MILVQHVLGIATAVLWFFAVRRVASPLWGLLPAAVVLFAGPQLFIEHAPLAESLFAFLIAAMVYCTVLALERRSALWGAAAGLLAMAAACVRVTGLLFVAIVIVWLAAAIGGDLRRRLTVAVAATLAAGLLFGVYLVLMKQETGYGGPTLTRSGNWGAPSQALPGPNYLERVRSDLARYWSSPNHGYLGGYNYDGFMGILDRAHLARQPRFRLHIPRPGGAVQQSHTVVPTVVTKASSGLLDTMAGYERRTRLEGIAFVVLLLLAAIGVPFAHGKQLAVGLLMAAITVATLLTPVLYLYFDARYAIPGYGPLAALAAIGAAALWERRAASARTGSARAGRQGPPAKVKA